MSIRLIRCGYFFKEIDLLTSVSGLVALGLFSLSFCNHLTIKTMYDMQFMNRKKREIVLDC